VRVGGSKAASRPFLEKFSIWIRIVNSDSAAVNLFVFGVENLFGSFEKEISKSTIIYRINTGYEVRFHKLLFMTINLLN